MPPARRRAALRTPPPPSPPRLPRLRRLRLAPIRPRGSTELDGARTRSGYQLPPFVRWDKFLADWRWRTGEHITVVGPTGAGKTLLTRQLLRFAPVARGETGPFVVVLGVKNRDRELYGPFQRDGYKLVRHFDPEPDEDQTSARILYVPRSDKYGVEGNREKGEQFRAALHGILRSGGWCVVADDLQYMSDDFHLSTEFKQIWKIGRSEDIELVGSSQEPVDIPPAAYGNATHLFLFKNPDLYRAKRMAELTGVNREVTQETILRLPPHEFVYVNKLTNHMVRSTVIESAADDTAV